MAARIEEFKSKREEVGGAIKGERGESKEGEGEAKVWPEELEGMT